MIKLSGQQGVPVTAADGEVILGFDQVRLKRLADKYGEGRRQPLGVLGANAEEYFANHPEAAEKVQAGVKGVYVGKVRPDTVADKAGLAPGDIISGLAGKRVRTMSELDRMIETLVGGDKVTLRFIRDGAEQTVQLEF